MRARWESRNSFLEARLELNRLLQRGTREKRTLEQLRLAEKGLVDEQAANWQAWCRTAKKEYEGGAIFYRDYVDILLRFLDFKLREFGVLQEREDVLVAELKRMVKEVGKSAEELLEGTEEFDRDAWQTISREVSAGLECDAR